MYENANIEKIKIIRLMEDYIPKTDLDEPEQAIGGHFFIPKYQRGYRWTSLQVRQLLDDINEFAYSDQEDNFYCLQPLVVQKDKNENQWIVIDGQQRLTSIYIIIKCLRCIADSQKKKPVYSLKYESKPELWDCLCELGKDEEIEIDKSDIDKYHITNAYKTVFDWVYSKAPGAEAEDFSLNMANKIRNGVCFIWYEINNGETPEEIFTNINMGKIPLTNAELIKALLLKKDNFTINEEYLGDQTRISMDWDVKENALHKSDFWLFLTNDKKEEQDVRIEMVFDVMARHILKEKGQEAMLSELREKNPTTYLFLVFSQKLEEMICKYKKECKEKYKYCDVLKEFWLEINKFYQMFQDWYEEKEWYHLVGYWVAANEMDSANTDINRILYELSDIYYDRSKKEFTLELKHIILSNLLSIKDPSVDKLDNLTYKELKYDLSQLRYGGTGTQVAKIKKSLLLFNVITMQTNMETDSKFPYHYYKKTTWNLEHIHSSVTDEPTTEKDRENWVRNVRMYLQNSEYISDEVSKKLLSFKDGKDEKCFDELYVAISEAFSGGALTEDIYHDGLPNLTLLDETINKSYKNDIFPMKRDCIMDKMGTESFVPICTKNVFLKYYTRNSTQNYAWDKDDRDWYFMKMCLAIYNYLTGNNYSITDIITERA